MNIISSPRTFSCRTSDTSVPYYEATLTVEVNERLFTSVRRSYKYPWSVTCIKETHRAVREDLICQVKEQFPETDSINFIKLFEGLGV